MYLLYCKNCGQIYSLKSSGHTYCSCEQTGGILNENDQVVYTGDPFLLRMPDTEFGQAIQGILRDQKEQKVSLTVLPINHHDFIRE